MKYKVVTVVVNLLEDPPTISEARAEVIDTQQISIFGACISIQDIEVTYEGYWNYRNNPNCIENPRAKLKVLSVEPIAGS